MPLRKVHHLRENPPHQNSRRFPLSFPITRNPKKVNVPPLVFKGIRHLQEKKIELANVERARDVLRTSGFNYASAWIGNHLDEYREGITSGFRESLADCN